MQLIDKCLTVKWLHRNYNIFFMDTMINNYINFFFLYYYTIIPNWLVLWIWAILHSKPCEMAVYQRYILGCDLAVSTRPQASAVGSHAYCMVTGVILCFNCMSVQTHKKPQRSVFENPLLWKLLSSSMDSNLWIQNSSVTV